MNNKINDDSIFDIIDKIDYETFKIFTVACNEKNISIYKYYLLKMKLQLLSAKLTNSLLSLLNNELYKMNKLIRLRTLIKFIYLLCVILFIISPILGCAAVFINLMNYLKITKRMQEEVISNETLMKILEEIRKIGIQFENCETFLEVNKNLEIEIMEEELSDEELKTIDLCGEKYILELHMEDNLKQENNSDIVNENTLDSEEMILKRIKNMKK